MKPDNLKTKIFLDSGDPNETEETIKLLGFLDGQTTNPSLIAKSPEAEARLSAGNKFSTDEVLSYYHQVVTKVSGLIPGGSVSIEVYADAETKAEAMLMQAREFFKWIPNAHIKFPTTLEGLKAAEMAVIEKMRVNMTLVFSQEQAAAVYTATKGASRGQVYLSPFIGRLDDRGENGMDLIKNIIQMYENSDHHVEVLTASVRSLDHFTQAINLGSDIITSPFKVLKDWAEAGFPSPIHGEGAGERLNNLKPIAYRQITLDHSWQSYNIAHELTDKGVAKFAEDWNNLIA